MRQLNGPVVVTRLDLSSFHLPPSASSTDKTYSTPQSLNDRAPLCVFGFRLKDEMMLNLLVDALGSAKDK